MAAPTDPLDVSRRYWNEALGDADQFFAMTAVMRLSRRVGDNIDQVLRSHAVNRNGYLILMSLELSGSGSMILGHLAQELIVHPTTVTLTIDKLEAEGFVKKQPHETDRRAVRATITKSGRATAKRITTELGAIGFGLGDLTPAQTAKLAAATNIARGASGDLDR